MKHWSDQRVAGAAGAQLARAHPDGRAADGPARVVIVTLSPSTGSGTSTTSICRAATAHRPSPRRTASAR